MTENRKNGFGATLSCVEFQRGPYKTSHPEYLKNTATRSVVVKCK